MVAPIGSQLWFGLDSSKNAGKPIVPILVFGLGFPLPPT